jgi:membrane protein YdbS with pleckstrin-like domain
MQDAANFCPNCGARAASASRGTVYSTPSTSPAFTLKPIFIPQLAITSVLPLQIFLTIWGTFFFGGFATVGLQAFDLGLPAWAPFVISGSVFFFGIPLLAYVTKQKSYTRTEYRFFPHKLDYFEGFFTVEEKSINYDNVTEVNLRKGVFQKMYGLGTIVLSTPATGFGNGRARSGIHIADVRNPDRVYQQIKDLIKRF